MKYIAVVVLFLCGCQSTPEIHSIEALSKLEKQINNRPHDIIGIANEVSKSHKAINADIATIASLYKQLQQFVEQEWGKSNSELPSQKKYVKYSNDYQARAIVDFQRGTVRVETIAKKSPLVLLKKAISETLLTTSDPRTTDIFSSKAPNTQGTPFLYKQVLDQDNKAVRYAWRAGRYADHLIKHKLSKHGSGKRTIHLVEFPLVDEHQGLRQKKYSEYVLASAKRYNISPRLIYAIIETESSFNPYAVSHANAYGLMQVVASTAGRDVYALVKNKKGEPSKSVLFDPAQNIDIGSAYLHLLSSRYLAKVKNEQSKEFSVISGYNGGAGNVLRTYASNRDKAFALINKQSSSNVYQTLTRQHPRAESRRYLEKVTKAKQHY